MASSSSLSRGFLSPTELALENTESRLRRYRYHEKPFSREANRALLLLTHKLRRTRELIRSSNNELQGERVTSLLSELKEVLYDVQDLADELEYLELTRKEKDAKEAKETKMPEAATSLSRRSKRPQDQNPRKAKDAKETNMPEAATSLSRGSKRPLDDVMINQLRQITNQLRRIYTHLEDAIGNVQDFNVGKQQLPVALPHHGFTGSSHWSLVLASI
ncbi:hypothetical protein J5N97_005965 [Dioscorea zingiberensis]|uniref:Uncharacterized protein n=1 Tax=Dioscorea zingiberensis TaxID=325984 RepID=A0A9D5DAQ7_9LILI|nr:hypothetical protein J5N97_005965 [Dioscorea zingiberensis]